MAAKVIAYWQWPVTTVMPYSPPGHRGQEGGGRSQEGGGVRRGWGRPPAAGATARCGLCSPLAVATASQPCGHGRGARGRGGQAGGWDGSRQTLDRGRRGRRRGRGQTLRLKRRRGAIGDEAPSGDRDGGGRCGAVRRAPARRRTLDEEGRQRPRRLSCAHGPGVARGRGVAAVRGRVTRQSGTVLACSKRARWRPAPLDRHYKR